MTEGDISKLQKFKANSHIPHDLTIHLSIDKLYRLLEVIDEKHFTAFVFHKRDLNAYIVLLNIKRPLTTTTALSYIKEVPTFNKKVFSIIEKFDTHQDTVRNIYTIYNLLNDKELSIPNMNVGQIATKYLNTYRSVKNKRNRLAGFVVISDHYIAQFAASLIKSLAGHADSMKKSESYKVMPLIEKWAEKDSLKSYSNESENIFMRMLRKIRFLS